jgi:uncharacterized protein YjbJ (UPF0337 family)
MTIKVGDKIPAVTLKTMGEKGPVDISTDDIFKGKWKQLRGSAKQTWGKLTDDDLERAGGDRLEVTEDRTEAGRHPPRRVGEQTQRTVGRR